MSTNTNQPPDTGSNVNNDTRTRANRRIDAKTISGIARFCAKQLTESEACRLLNVRPQSWFSWKSRHNRAEKFAALLEAFHADRLNSLIEQIENGAKGVNMKQPDWRAAAHLLAVTGDMGRFGAKAEAPPPPQPANQLSDETMMRLLAVLRTGNVKAAASVTAGPPRVLIGESSVPEPELEDITPGGNP
jgi:hypothetical protein